MIHVLASIRVKPSKRHTLIEHLKSNIPHVIKEKGCIYISLSKKKQDCLACKGKP